MTYTYCVFIETEDANTVAMQIANGRPVQGAPTGGFRFALAGQIGLRTRQAEGFPASCVGNDHVDREEVKMPQKRANVKNEKQYEALKDKGMSKERAAKIANSPGASSRGGKKSGSGGSPSQGGTTAQKKAAGRKGGKATARKRS